MVYKNKELYDAYQKEWKKRNPEKVKAIRHRCNAKLKHNVRAYNAEYKQRKPWLSLLYSARRRSKKAGMDYLLTPEWAKSTWTGYCSLTGIKFNLEYGDTPGWKYLSPSIDRIDNSKGYSPDNCRFILNCINCFKGGMTDKEMFEIAEALHNVIH